MKKRDFLRLTAIAGILIIVLLTITLSLQLSKRPVVVPTLMQLPSETAQQVAAAPTGTPDILRASAQASIMPGTSAISVIASSATLEIPTVPASPASMTLPMLTSIVASLTKTGAGFATVTTETRVFPTALPFPTLPLLPAPISTYTPAILPAPQERVPNQVVIAFKQGTSQQAQAAYIASVGGVVKQSIDALDTVVVEIPQQSVNTPLLQSAAIVQTEPDYYVSALVAVPPSDPYYAQQWALPVIGAPEAWLSLPADAPKVTVAVIDSGICADNPDLTGRVLPGWDFIDNDNTPRDDFGHGCGVAGIIAANDEDGIGMAGVAPNALVMPLRVLDAQGIGTYSNVAAAIVYAVDHDAQIINLSLGGVNPSSILQTAVDYAASHGVIIVAAAGNTGGSVIYPAAYPSVVAVGSVDKDLQPSSFSSRGPEIDIWAPGRDILTTTRDGQWTTMSGTSFASPYVAGAEAIEIALGRKLQLNAELLDLGAAETISGTPMELSPLEPTLDVSTPLPNTSETDLDQAALDTTTQYLGNISESNVTVSDVQIVGNWGFGMTIVRASGDSDGAPELYLFVAQRANTDQPWQVALEPTPTFQEWLAAAPTDFMSVEARSLLLTETSAEGNGSAMLSLPFGSGETWTLTGGPHQDSGNDQTGRAALDFSGGSGKVRAANDGVVWRSSACPNFIRIDHANGWQTGYYHVINEAVSNGQTISRGQIIADQGTGVGCGGTATGPHVHFSLRLNGVPFSMNNVDIGGWNVQQGANEYDGCLTNLRTGARACQWQTIYNDGAIGSNNSNAQYQGRLQFAVDQLSKTMIAGQQYIWDYVLPGGISNYLIDIQKVSGNLRYDMVLRGPDGQIVVSAPSGIDGRGILPFEGGAAAGTYTLTLIPQTGTSGVYNITLWNNSIPRMFFIYDSSGYSNVLHWQWYLDQTYTYNVIMNRLDGNFEYNYRLVNRSNGQTFASGSSYNGGMLTAATSGVGWYDLYLTPLNSSHGSYFIDIRQGLPNPGTPSIISPIAGASLSGSFNVQLQRGLFNQTGAADFHVQVDNNSDFSSVDYDSVAAQGRWSIGTTIPVSVGFTGTAYIRAQQGDTVGSASDWSAPVAISIINSAPQISIVNSGGPNSMEAGQQARIHFDIKNLSGVNLNAKIYYEVTNDLPGGMNGYATLFFPTPGGSGPALFNQTLGANSTNSYAATGYVSYQWNQPTVNECTGLIPPDAPPLGVLISLLTDDVVNWIEGELIPADAAVFKKIFDDIGHFQAALGSAQTVLQATNARGVARFTFTPVVVVNRNGVDTSFRGTPININVRVPQSKIDDFSLGIGLLSTADPLMDIAWQVPHLAKIPAVLLALQPTIAGCNQVFNSANIDMSSVIAQRTVPFTLGATPQTTSWNLQTDDTPLRSYLEYTTAAVGNAWYYISQRNDQLLTDASAQASSKEDLIASVNTSIQAIDSLNEFLNYDTSGYDYFLFRQALGTSRTQLVQFGQAATSLLSNGTFENGTSGWTWTSDLTASLNDGIFSITRTDNLALGSLSQNASFGATPNTPFELNFQMGNSSGLPKTVTAIVRGPQNLVGSFQCTFAVSAGSALSNYHVRGLAGATWSTTQVQFIIQSADNAPALMLDNINLQSNSSLVISRTECASDNNPPPTQFVSNGSFDSGMAGWQTYGNITARTDNGVFEFYHNAALGSVRPSLLQAIPSSFNSGTSLELRVDLGNNGPTRKRALVFMVNQDWTDLQTCSFWLEPNTPLRTYILQGRPTVNWPSAQVAIYANPADSTGWMLVDNVGLQQISNAVSAETRCIDPTAPAAKSGSDSSNLIINGGFSAGMSNWIIYGNITSRLTNNVFEFYHNTTQGSTRPSILQNTGTGLAANTPLELQLQLGNSGSVRKRALIILFESDWSDFQICSFWIPPNTPLSTYAMQTYLPHAWTNASISIYANPADNTGWLQVDNVSLKYRPSLGVIGTTCLEPGTGVASLAAMGAEVLPVAPSLEAPTEEATPETTPEATSEAAEEVTAEPIMEATTQEPTVEATDISLLPTDLPTALSFPTLPPPPLPNDLPTALPFPTLPPPITPIPSATPTPLTLPASATLNDGALNWSYTAGWTLQPRDAGLAFSMQSTTNETLWWQQSIDLRSIEENVELTFQSKFVGDGLATVQVSIDGVTWQPAAVVPASDDWTTVNVDLSAYTGNILQFEFGWQDINATTVDQWAVDNIVIDQEIPTVVPPQDTAVPTLISTSSDLTETVMPTDIPLESSPAPTELATSEVASP